MSIRKPWSGPAIEDDGQGGGSGPPPAPASLARALADVLNSTERDRFSRIEKRSVTVSGHPTSLSLEGGFWACLKLIADHRGQSLAGLIAEVDSNRDGNLSSALRVHVLREVLAALPFSAPDPEA